MVRYAPLIAAFVFSAGHAAGSDPRPIDDFRDPSAWSATASDGVGASLQPVDAPGGRGLCLDYDFNGFSGYAVARREWYLDTLVLIRDRFHTLTDFAEAGRAYFADDYSIDPKPLAKNILKQPELKQWLPQLAEQRRGCVPPADAVLGVERVRRRSCPHAARRARQDGVVR